MFARAYSFSNTHSACAPSQPGHATPQTRPANPGSHTHAPSASSGMATPAVPMTPSRPPSSVPCFTNTPLPQHSTSHVRPVKNSAHAHVFKSFAASYETSSPRHESPQGCTSHCSPRYPGSHTHSSGSYRESESTSSENAEGSLSTSNPLLSA